MKNVVCTILSLLLVIGSSSPGFAISNSIDKTAFPLKLFKQLAKEKEKETQNVLVSPFSISSALGMSLNGASGPTKEEMKQVLGYGNSSILSVNKNVKNTLASLSTLPKETKLEIANAIFAKSGTDFNKSFLQRNKQFYNSHIQALNFNSPNAVSKINGWVSLKTHKKIPAIIERVTSNDVLFLVNAIYFKSSWLYEFNKRRTRTQNFFVGGKATKKVQMMHMTRDDYKYYETAGFQAVKLKYKDKRLSLILILPRSNESLSLFESELSRDTWVDILTSFRSKRGHLGLPRFKIEDQYSLKQPLSKLGMANAFLCNKADFSAMTANKERLYISRVIHKSFMEVNEEGTEAAAATVVAHTSKGLFQPPAVPTFQMILNRPFLFAVHDSKTDTILFMGHIANPK